MPRFPLKKLNVRSPTYASKQYAPAGCIYARNNIIYSCRYLCNKSLLQEDYIPLTTFFVSLGCMYHPTKIQN